MNDERPSRREMIEEMQRRRAAEKAFTCTSEAELVNYFAHEIKDIAANGTDGAYTWSGLLWSFAGALDVLRANGSVTFVPMREVMPTEEPG